MTPAWRQSVCIQSFNEWSRINCFPSSWPCCSMGHCPYHTSPTLPVYPCTLCTCGSTHRSIPCLIYTHFQGHRALYTRRVGCTLVQHPRWNNSRYRAHRSCSGSPAGEYWPFSNQRLDLKSVGSYAPRSEAGGRASAYRPSPLLFWMGPTCLATANGAYEHLQWRVCCCTAQGEKLCILFERAVVLILRR